ILAPVLAGYQRIQASYGFKRSPVEIVNYSADVAGLWSAAPDSLPWRRRQGAGVSSESEQFPGIAIAILACAGIALALKRRTGRAEVLFYAVASGVRGRRGLG